MSTNLALEENPHARDTAKATTNPQEADPKASCEIHSRAEFPEPVRATQQAALIEPTGPLGGEFVHDLNNLLTVISGHTEFLLKRKESPEISRARVEEIRNAAERGAWLAKQLLASAGFK